MRNKVRYILQKRLHTLPCRFILGVIGPSRELSPVVRPGLIIAVEGKFGPIEEVMPTQDFPKPPKAYFEEMGRQPLATSMIILENGGAYTDLHTMENDSVEIEDRFMGFPGGRMFNINPGAVGTHGITLASHKPTGGRRNIGAYAYGSQPHTLDLFREDTYHERIIKWKDGRLILMDNVAVEGKFIEYAEESRVARFEELIRGLPKNDVAVELMADL